MLTGSDSQEDTSRDNAGGSGVHSGGLATTEGQVANSTVGAAAGLDVGSNKVDASNDTRVGTLVSLLALKFRMSGSN